MNRFGPIRRGYFSDVKTSHFGRRRRQFWVLTPQRVVDPLIYSPVWRLVSNFNFIARLLASKWSAQPKSETSTNWKNSWNRRLLVDQPSETPGRNANEGFYFCRYIFSCCLWTGDGDKCSVSVTVSAGTFRQRSEVAAHRDPLDSPQRSVPLRTIWQKHFVDFGNWIIEMNELCSCWNVPTMTSSYWLI